MLDARMPYDQSSHGVRSSSPHDCRNHDAMAYTLSYNARDAICQHNDSCSPSLSDIVVESFRLMAVLAVRPHTKRCAACQCEWDICLSSALIAMAYKSVSHNIDSILFRNIRAHQYLGLVSALIRENWHRSNPRFGPKIIIFPPLTHEVTKKHPPNHRPIWIWCAASAVRSMYGPLVKQMPKAIGQFWQRQNYHNWS